MTKPFSTLLLVASIGILFLTGLTSASAQENQPATTQPAAKSEPKPLEYVRMKTNLGDIVLELNREKAPISVENFLAYADGKQYDGTIFHRVMSNFMIQGGGFTEKLEKRSVMAPIKNEWRNGLKNVRGTISMARLGGNVDSATNQFFINVKDNPNLDVAQRDGAAYAVFGKVVKGIETVEKIRYTRTQNGVATSSSPQQRLNNVPVKTVVIESVTRLTKEEIDSMRGKKTAGDDKPATKPASPPTSRPSR